MSATSRVILITTSGPGGQVDVGVRSDATPADLLASLGTVIGIRSTGLVAEHQSPPRPGVPLGARARLNTAVSLADSGVADGDMVVFKSAAAHRSEHEAAHRAEYQAAHRAGQRADDQAGQVDQGAESDEPADRH